MSKKAIIVARNIQSDFMPDDSTCPSSISKKKGIIQAIHHSFAFPVSVLYVWGLKKKVSIDIAMQAVNKTIRGINIIVKSPLNIKKAIISKIKGINHRGAQIVSNIFPGGICFTRIMTSLHPNGQKVNIFLTKRRSQMRKVLAVAVLGILLVSGIAVAREVVTRTVENSANNSTMVVNGTTVYTKVIPIGDAEYLGVSYHVYNPSGNTNITIQFEQDALGTVPGTEGAADGNYTIATGVTDIVTALTTESTWYTKALSVPGTAYGRFKITETAATPTQVQMRLHKTVN